MTEGIDYAGLPLALRAGMEAYIEEGRRTGGFLTAVMSNALIEAAARADVGNRASLATIALWVSHNAPTECYGSGLHYDSWIKRGGLKGINAKIDLLPKRLGDDYVCAAPPKGLDTFAEPSPIVVNHHGEVIDGHQRLALLLRNGGDFRITMLEADGTSSQKIVTKLTHKDDDGGKPCG